MNHPFAMSRFKVATLAQLKALHTSGVQQVRVDLLRSDAVAVAQWRSAVAAEVDVDVDAGSVEWQLSRDAGDAAGQDVAVEVEALRIRHVAETQPPTRPVQPSEPTERFIWAADCYLELCEQVQMQSSALGDAAQALVQDYVQELGQSHHTMLHLLAGRAGEHAAAHPVNVTILSLLVGKFLGMGEQQLYDMGMAALLHDIGKVQLPPALRTQQSHMDAEDVALYQSHVGASVVVAHAIGLSPDVQQYIAQHHEFQDGSGYPLGLMGEDLVLPAQVLALVNTYDHLCNTSAQTPSHTPHEAVSVLFAQRKHHFGADVIRAFIGVMGVYPPGTVVQLSDGRYGVVSGVSSKNPRKPQVRVHDGPLSMTGSATVVLDLDALPGLLIKRSLRPEQLPRDILESLSPQRRICYFFERAVDISAQRKMP